jgi:hypothetical protein
LSFKVETDRFFQFWIGNISGAHSAHIKSDSSIIDPKLLERLRERRLFAKILSHDGEVFSLRYVNSIGSEIDRSNLIYVSCTPMSYVHQICFLLDKPCYVFLSLIHRRNIFNTGSLTCSPAGITILIWVQKPVFGTKFNF